MGRARRSVIWDRWIPQPFTDHGARSNATPCFPSRPARAFTLGVTFHATLRTHMDKTELRLDPLTRDWTIFNESRALPPTTASVRDDVLAESPFRAGLESFAAHALHHSAGESGWQVRVVPNRLPVLRVEGDSKAQADGLYEHLDAVGANEIVIEDPGTRTLDELPPMRG